MNHVGYSQHASATCAGFDREGAPEAHRHGPGDEEARTLRLHPLGRRALPQGERAPRHRSRHPTCILRKERRVARGDRRPDRGAGVAREVARGEIWLLKLPSPDRRRPVLVLSRPSLLEVLHTATVASITSTLRGAPTEVTVGPEDGLKQISCVNLTNVFTVRKSELRNYVASLSIEKMRDVCRALNIACGCD